MPVVIGLFIALLVFGGIPGCMAVTAYNGLVLHDARVSEAHAKLNSVYQKRADLVGNLVDTVKASGSYEGDTLIKVTEARGKATSVQLPANASDEDMKKWSAAQAELRQGLGRLLAVAESYPTLTATAGYLRLQGQIKAIETQCDAARRVYIREVRDYNLNVKSFPRSLFAGFYGYTVKPQLEFEDEPNLKKSPRVNFGTKS